MPEYKYSFEGKDVTVSIMGVNIDITWSEYYLVFREHYEIALFPTEEAAEEYISWCKHRDTQDPPTI